MACQRRAHCARALAPFPGHSSCHGSFQWQYCPFLLHVAQYTKMLDIMAQMHGLCSLSARATGTKGKHLPPTAFLQDKLSTRMFATSFARDLVADRYKKDAEKIARALANGNRQKPHVRQTPRGTRGAPGTAVSRRLSGTPAPLHTPQPVCVCKQSRSRQLRGGKRGGASKGGAFHGGAPGGTTSNWGPCGLSTGASAFTPLPALTTAAGALQHSAATNMRDMRFSALFWAR